MPASEPLLLAHVLSAWVDAGGDRLPSRIQRGAIQSGGARSTAAMSGASCHPPPSARYRSTVD